MAIDPGCFDLSGALDFAIGNEEDAQLRYEEFAARVSDPAAASFFRHMVVIETEHRRQLMARRDVIFRHGARRFDTSIASDGWLPEPGEVVTTISVREAMQVALAAERNSYRFYDVALRTVTDPDVRALFEELRDEEAEHEAALRNMLEALGRDQSAPAATSARRTSSMAAAESGAWGGSGAPTR